MKIKKHISKIISVTLWMSACIAMLVVLSAAVKAKKSASCTGYKISFNGVTDGQYFIDKRDVLKLIGEAKDHPLEGRSISSLDLDELEKRLRGDVWIRDADIYLDNNNCLRIHITERVPVARVFTNRGNSFYIDSSGSMLPLSARMPARVPVFTGFPDRLRNSGDSSLVSAVSTLSTTILKDEFWMAQIQQIVILPNNKFELYPLIGDHIIEFGTIEDYQEKFRRLMLFYKEVLTKTGFDKYSIIKAQFSGQIVGVKRNAAAANHFIPDPVSVPVMANKPSVAKPPAAGAGERKTSGVKSTNPSAGKKTVQPAKAKINRQPRAVMPQQNNKPDP